MTTDQLPDLGLGTWKNTDPKECAQSVSAALEVGYRHVDTAQYYGNEEHVGRGIADAGIDRSEITVATKLHPETSGLGYHDVLGGVEASLDRLRLDYVDLLYVHWPVLDYDAEETLPAFETLVDRGTIRHIGVSNFSIELLDEARDVLDRPLFAHQVEMHPLFQQEELVEYAQDQGHYLVAYAPLARGKVFDVEPIPEIARKHGATEAQVALAWVLSKDNVVAIPGSTNPDHMRDNLAARDLELDEEDVALIDSIDREERLVERDGAPWLD